MNNSMLGAVETVGIVRDMVYNMNRVPGHHRTGERREREHRVERQAAHGNNTVIIVIKTLEGFMMIDTFINNVITSL